MRIEQQYRLQRLLKPLPFPSLVELVMTHAPSLAQVTLAQQLPDPLLSSGRCWVGGAWHLPVSDHGESLDRVVSGYGLAAGVSASPTKSPA